MLYTIHNVLRLCRRQTVYLNKRLTQTRAVTGAEHEQKGQKQSETKDFPHLLQKYKDKITFNNYLEKDKLKLGYFKYYKKTVRQAKQNVSTEYEEKRKPPLPVSLQYYVDKGRLLQDENVEITSAPDKQFQLPFGTSTKIEFDDKDVAPPKIDVNPSNTEQEFDRSNINRWMTNYEYFDDTKLSSEEIDDEDWHDEEWSKHYGTPDPTAAVSSVPCGGCGALLHCSDPAIPGYLPSEIFKNRQEDELKTLECQRCHFLKEYNIALDISVQPEEYEKLLQSIRNVKSLVLLMVDLLDFPCSIWPGIVDIIGKHRPIIVVANKVDLLPGDSHGYLKRVKHSLVTEIRKTKLGEANIKHIALISAKTGYGVEDLISAMFKQWMYKGDVFLVGCTNVGKSSLFNALLQSDYCKVHATDIIKRATVSRWPGTTLNLLKFPINRPSGWKIYQRSRRLNSEAKLYKVEKQIRNAQLDGKIPTEAPALIGHIGRSFSELHDLDKNETFKEKKNIFDEKDKLFANSKWLYDTPGVIHPDQVLSLLSTEELLVTIPKQLIRPQTYFLYEGSTIFIGGLARIDLVNSSEPCRFTIFCSECLPITVTKTEDADEIYEQFVGTELFAAPSGGAERLKNWPGLQEAAELLEFSGEGPKTVCGDIVLSSVAWVGVTAKTETTCKIRAWTPGARGIYRRQPSILPFSINLKGKRLRDTPAYTIGKVFF
ncbi:nitric oxide-associated protein 1 isoform X1 [Helicoverpa armigera]|uniref:nitric oxide-associated protein 1 isoform X1 n=1 Tax=Helicoverpa armigera TaxID=29058 RepID=UPI003082A837